MFFRTCALLALDIKPVFVMDGAAPELKRETLTQRSSGEEVKSLNRKRLKAVTNECKFLLETMGIQCLQSKGEGNDITVCKYMILNLNPIFQL